MCDFADLCEILQGGATERLEDYRVNLIYNGRPASLFGNPPGQMLTYSDFVTKLKEFVPLDVPAACAV